MPKIKKLRQHNLKYSPYENSHDELETGNTSIEETVAVLSKGQKKRQENKVKVMRKIGLISPMKKLININKNKRKSSETLYSELESNLKKNNPLGSVENHDDSKL